MDANIAENVLTGRNTETLEVETNPADVMKGFSNWEDLLDRVKSGPNKGKVKSSIRNAVTALTYHPKLAGVFAYNEFSAAVEVNGSPWKRFSNRASDPDYDFLYLMLEDFGITSREKINSAVNIVSYENSYHPVRDLLNSLKGKWDGKDHISELFPKYLGAERNEYTKMVTLVMFGGIISRTFKPGSKYDTAIVLTDTEQGVGKSTLCRFLALKDDWYTSLNSVDDKSKVVETITGHLIVEMDEMESLVTAKSIETVRSFLSRASDTYRTPYDRFSRDIRRGSICIGTSNDPAFLPMDRAGNRRFLPIRCNKNDAQIHPLDDEQATRNDILQCYAQAMYLYEHNQLPITLPNKFAIQLPKIQSNFTPEDSKAVKIEQWIVSNSQKEDTDITKYNEFCVAMIYEKALGQNGTPKQWESKEIAAILNNLRYTDADGNPTDKILKRYENSGGIKRIKDYGRCKAWVIADPEKMKQYLKEESEASEQPVNKNGASEQEFMLIPDDQMNDIPFP